MSKHNSGCRCLICEGRGAELAEMERQAMLKEGWYAHMVPGNYHTHGIEQTLGHPDLQMVLPLDPHLLHSIAHGIVDEIRKGRRFAHGDIVGQIIKRYNVRFVEAREGDRTVLRVIFPDAEGHLLLNELTGMYAEQYNSEEPN